MRKLWDCLDARARVALGMLVFAALAVCLLVL